MKKFKLTALTGAMLLLGASAANAVDFDGYLRAGPGATTKSNAARGCYKMNTPGMQYRLGNECDFYGEFGFAQTGNVGGVTYKGYLMIAKYEADSNGNANGANNNVFFEQMYVEGSGYDVLPEAKFWAGKRFYDRFNVDMVDTFYSNLSGTGGGMYNVGMGPGKFGISYFKDDLNTDGTGLTAPGIGNSGLSGHRINVEYYDLPVNPGGKIHIIGTLTDGDYDRDNAVVPGTKGNSGAGITVMHFQENLFGLGKDTANTFFAQYSQGSAGLNGAFGSATDGSGRKSWRLVESLTWQVGAFGGQAQAMVQQDKYDGSVPSVFYGRNGDGTYSKKTSWTVGGRGSYAVTNNFKLLLEAGYSEIHPDGQETAKLAKLTFAPALTVGPGYFNRPELRAYVTAGKWNGAARNFDGSNSNTLIDPAFLNSRSGISYGLQAEMWF